MAKTIALITIHGMGETTRDYYADFYHEVKDTLKSQTLDKVIFKSLYYQDFLQTNQVEIFSRMRDKVDWMKLRKFLMYGFSDASSLEHKKEEINSPYFLTQEMILESMDEIFHEAGDIEIPVIIVAQSLGCQVISSYIWDTQSPSPKAGIWSVARNDGIADNSPQDNFRKMKSLRRLYSTGSNIPLFVSGHRQILAIAAPSPSFKWYNFYDEDDVLGWPLQPLSPSYEALVTDIPINANGGIAGGIIGSWNPVSHTQYWETREFIKHISLAVEALA